MGVFLLSGIDFLKSRFFVRGAFDVDVQRRKWVRQVGYRESG